MGFFFFKPSRIVRLELDRGPKGSRSVAFARISDVPSVSYWGWVGSEVEAPVPSAMPGDAFDS